MNKAFTQSTLTKRLMLLGLGLCLHSGLVTAKTELVEIHLSADIHTTAPTSGGARLITRDDDILTYDFSTGLSDGTAFLGALDQSDLDAYHAADVCGQALFSVDSTAEIAGTVMRPADVFQSNGVKILDAVAEGIADGANLDAVSRVPGLCDLVVSFDVTVEIDGTVFRPADLVRFGAGSFSLYREGPDSGNLDAVHVLDAGSVLASFAAPVPNLGIGFTDQDVIEQAEAGGNWALSFQPSAIDPSWEPADTDALSAVRGPAPGNFSWANAEVEALESDGSVELDIERLGFSDGPVTVSYATADDTALGGIDYGSSSGGVAFSDGELLDRAVITLFDNGTMDGDRFFFVDLTAATNGANLVSPTRVRVLIRDDEGSLFSDRFESNQPRDLRGQL